MVLPGGSVMRWRIILAAAIAAWVIAGCWVFLR